MKFNLKSPCSYHNLNIDPMNSVHPLRVLTIHYQFEDLTYILLPLESYLVLIFGKKTLYQI